MPFFSDNRYSDFEINLLLSYCCVCIGLSFSPYHRLTWLVENATVWLCAALVLYLRIKKHRFSKISVVILFSAAVIHTVGGHFSFQLVPGGKLLTLWGPEGRNNFDRFGHFFCGLLTYPLLEYINAQRLVRSFIFAFFLSAMGIMGVAALYELIEWLDVIIAEARFGEIYMGTQGDPWDAQADMFMCLLGCITSGLILLCKPVCSALSHQIARLIHTMLQK